MRPLKSLGVLWRAMSKELRGLVSCLLVSCVGLYGDGGSRSNPKRSMKCLECS